jgi:YHS domain-containing protein
MSLFRLSHCGALATAFLAMSMLAASPARAIVQTSTSAVDTDDKGLAMQGYDPVAYFTDGAPKAGDPKFQTKYGGATYYFSSEANLKTFTANPAAYTPQYGGFCAMGTAHGLKLEGDPHLWHVVDKKLYLNVNAAVDTKWKQDVPGNITTANDKWPKVKDKAPDELQPQ